MSSAQKMAKGTVTKRVSCQRCHRFYEYEMMRLAFGKSAKNAPTQEEAKMQASQDAEAKLQALLEDECDVVACPSCGAITDEMKTHRLKSFGYAFAGMGMGAGFLLAEYLHAIFFGRFHIFITAGAGLLLLAGVGFLGLVSVQAFRPRKGKV